MGMRQRESGLAADAGLEMHLYTPRALSGRFCPGLAMGNARAARERRKSFNETVGDSSGNGAEWKAMETKNARGKIKEMEGWRESAIEEWRDGGRVGRGELGRLRKVRRDSLSLTLGWHTRKRKETRLVRSASGPPYKPRPALAT